MSIMIKGMDMPKACEWCNFISTFTTESGLGCRCEVGKFEFWDYAKRQENCPLTEIPTPHGRGIDADKLTKVIEDAMNRKDNPLGYDAAEILGEIYAAKTIIEAEE